MNFYLVYRFYCKNSRIALTFPMEKAVELFYNSPNA